MGDTTSLVDMTGFQPSFGSLFYGAGQDGPIRGLGVYLETLGTSVDEAVQHSAGLWAGLSQVYQAPETDRVLGLVAPAVTNADEVAEGTAGVKRALDVYADDLMDIADRLQTLESDVLWFRQRAVDGPLIGEWHQDEGMISENSSLVRRIAQVEQDLQAAARAFATRVAQVLPEVGAWIAYATAATVFGGPGIGVSRLEDLEAYNAEQGWGAPRELTTYGDLPHLQLATGAWREVQSWGGLIGYNVETDKWWDGHLAGASWKGMLNVTGSTLVAVLPVLAVPGLLHHWGVPTGSFGAWSEDRLLVVRDTEKTMAGWDPEKGWTWREDPFGTAGRVGVNVAALLLPVKGVGAGAKGAGAGARFAEVGAVGAETAAGAARVGKAGAVMRVVAEAVTPTGSYAVHGAAALARGFRALPDGWTAAVAAVHDGWAAGTRVPHVPVAESFATPGALTPHAPEVPNPAGRSLNDPAAKDSVLYQEPPRQAPADNRPRRPGDQARDPALVGARADEVAAVAGSPQASLNRPGTGGNPGPARTNSGGEALGGRGPTSDAGGGSGGRGSPGNGAGRGGAGTDGAGRGGNGLPEDPGREMSAGTERGDSGTTAGRGGASDGPDTPTAVDRSHLPPEAREAIATYERMISDEFAKPDPEYWRIGRWEGSIFNWENYHRYPANEIRLDLTDPNTGVPLLNANGNPRWAVVDSYIPGREIVSRKRTQLAEIAESTAREYINEAVRLYGPNRPGITIADVPTTRSQLAGYPGAIGRALDGNLVLEVPVQRQPVPESILRHAAESRVTIRDVDGNIYRLEEGVP
ncbi:MAG: hypothetical protein FWE61_06420 [Micrococcales bacterium]|nr:hypothetical protein [Micrococcales bacterium]